MKEKYYSFEFVQRRNRRLIRNYNISHNESVRDEIIMSTIPLVNEIIWVFSEYFGWEKDEESEYKDELTVYMCEEIKKPVKFCPGFSLYLARKLEKYILKISDTQKIRYIRI